MSQARAELHQEQPNNPLFATILAEVYAYYIQPDRQERVYPRTLCCPFNLTMDRLIHSLSQRMLPSLSWRSYCQAALCSEHSNQPYDDLDSYDVQGCISIYAST